MKKYLYIALVLSLIALPQVSLADVLSVTGITAVKTSAMANGDYSDGWSWLFNIHIPKSESSSTTLRMKFGDWTNGSASIPTTNNIRIYSDQALNASTSDSALTITGANAYSDSLILKDDSGGVNGRDVQVTVEVRVPTGSTGGSYSTSYGISSSGTTTPIIKEELVATDLAVSLSPLSPSSRAVSISLVGGQDTTDVVLAVYRFKSNNRSSSINTLVFSVATNPDLGGDLGSSMKIWKLSDGVNRYYGTQSGSTITFTIDPGLVLIQDISKDLTLSADIVASSNAFTASTTLKVGQIVATDVNDDPVSITSETDITGSNITFTPWALVLTSISRGDNSYSFNLTNNSDSNLFVSKTSPSGPLDSTGSSNDTETAYFIPAGSVRSFSLYSVESLTSITINYGTSSSNPTNLSLTQDLVL